MKPVKMFSHISFFLMLMFFFISTSPGSIVNTLTSAGMKITSTDGSIIYASMEEANSLSSHVNVSHAPWQANAFSHFWITDLAAESVRVNFSVGMSAYNGSAYMGESSTQINHIIIHYDADVDTELNVSYLYDLTLLKTGSPSASELGLLQIWIREGYVSNPPLWLNPPWTQILWAGQFGSTWNVKHFEGTGSYLLQAGKEYSVAVWTMPGAMGQLGALGAGAYSLADVLLQFRCVINLEEYANLASMWLQTGCQDPDWCNGADLDHSTEVDISDLTELAAYWLDYCPDSWQ